MFYSLPISSRAAARSEVKFAIICEKISHWYAESLYKLSFNSNCFAWSLHLDDVINKLLKRLLVSFKPIANSLKVMDHYNFDTWRKLDFCSGDRNIALEPTLCPIGKTLILIFEEVFFLLPIVHNPDSSPSFISEGWKYEHWTLNSAVKTSLRAELSPWFIALSDPDPLPHRDGEREENCDTESWRPSLVMIRAGKQSACVHLYSQTRLSWRSIKSGSCAEGKLSRQLPDDVRLRISLTGSRFLSFRHWRHPSSASEWHNRQNTITECHAL